MFISLQELELRRTPFAVEVAPEAIDLVGDVRQLSPLRATGWAELANGTLGEVRVAGKITVTMEAVCDRCLDPVRMPIEHAFDLIYRPTDEFAAGGEDEIRADEAAVAFYEGNGLELNDVLREMVLLALPMQIVCGEACRGICPSCGLNRNHGECHCKVTAVDDRWSKLKAFRVQMGPAN